MNVVTLHGNVTREPELRYSANGTASLRFGLAVNRRWTDRSTGQQQEAVSFFDVSCFGMLAENCAETLTKGDAVLVAGRLNQSTWGTAEGEKRSKVEVIASEVGASLLFRPVTIDRTVRAGSATQSS